MHAHEEGHHPPSYRLLIGVWGALMVLTAVTVWVAQVPLGFLNVVAAMAVATCKALLVTLFFMHLKDENWTFKGMVLLVFVILAIFIGFTFFDTAYR
ncbi:MAG: cytochrome C oxidase subunit IV family protein [Desulfovibrionaceae bacterium]|jgi:cytochrome c oxidase subunit 4|nr:cytochrome C oxidase subunit IV family protein [Desulfovibrionaceae bacterium]